MRIWHLRRHVEKEVAIIVHLEMPSERESAGKRRPHKLHMKSTPHLNYCRVRNGVESRVPQAFLDASACDASDNSAEHDLMLQ
eukprot:962410-Amphidinium_carterae.3